MEIEWIKHSCIWYHHTVNIISVSSFCYTGRGVALHDKLLLTSSFHTFSLIGWCQRCTGWPSIHPAAAGQHCWKLPSGCWSPCSPHGPLSTPWWSGSYGWVADWGVRRCGLQNGQWQVKTVAIKLDVGKKIIWKKNFGVKKTQNIYSLWANNSPRKTIHYHKFLHHYLCQRLRWCHINNKVKTFD